MQANEIVKSRYKKHMVSQWDHFLCTYKITITMIQCGTPVSICWYTTTSAQY